MGLPRHRGDAGTGDQDARGEYPVGGYVSFYFVYVHPYSGFDGDSGDFFDVVVIFSPSLQLCGMISICIMRSAILLRTLSVSLLKRSGASYESWYVIMPLIIEVFPDLVNFRTTSGREQSAL
jgi:hypothetical protein